jgi:peroxiredoxin
LKPEALLRLLAGGALTLALLGGLWHDGLLSAPSGDTTRGEGVRPIALAPDTSIETPPLAGLDVGLRPGDLAPDFAFSGYLGERRTLSSFRGRPVVLNFWAGWCGPCKAEMAALEDAISRHAGAGLAVVAVNNGETYDSGRAFVDANRLDLTAFAVDPGGDIARRYRVEGMPTTYFIDAGGVIRRVVPGALDASDIDAALTDAFASWTD